MTTLGLFDSGLGGLSVLRAVRAALPAADLVYLGDSAHVPYGPRPLAEVCRFARAIARFLQDQGARLIVVACNAASAAALSALRQAPEFAGLPFVGMEPAVKPAAETTRSGVVGVLATPAAFQGELYASVVERFAQGVIVLPQVCPGLVQQIEAGAVDTPATERMLRGWVEPMLAQGIDALVLGCTHYPFVIPLLNRICGPGVRVIDPAPAVARQAARMWAAHGFGTPTDAAPGRLTYYTTGSVAAFAQNVARLGLERAEVRSGVWRAGRVTAA
ncbi:MAG: glutamate racemase [Anaerolineales bacterium]|nr:glutamate racemase [Anaerolineales bacterium]